MKKIHYPFILLFFVLIACSESDSEPIIGDFTGTWAGDLGCLVESVTVSFDVVLNIQTDDARCANCYMVGFSNGGQQEDVLLATEVDGALVLDRSVVDMGGMDGTVSIEGTCHMTGDGKMEFDLEMNQTSGENFGFACTTTLSRQ